MNSQTIIISSGTILRTLLFAALAVVLYELLHVVLVVLTAVVIASAIEPGVTALEEHNIPRVLSVISIYLLTLAGVVLFIVFFLPPIISDISGIFTQAPEYIRSLQLEGSFLAESFGTAADPLSISEIINRLQAISLENTEDIFGVVSSVFGGVLNFLLIVTLSFYLSVQRDGVQNFLQLVVPTEHEEYVLDLWDRTRVKIGKWLQGQFVMMVAVGLLSYIGLSLLSVPNAGLLAIIAGVFEIIPVFGPILSSVPAISLAFLYGGLSLALMTTGLYIIIQQIEGNILNPLVFDQVVGLSPVVVILSIVIGGQLAGFLGILLSIPLAAGLMEFAQDVNEAKHANQKSIDDTAHSTEQTSS
jgi:predicted PurR-regulated permease PerM